MRTYTLVIGLLLMFPVLAQEDASLPIDVHAVFNSTISNFSKTLPSSAFESFEYKSYSSTLVINEGVSSVAEETAIHNYFFEQITLHQASNNNFKETVIASNTPGFEAPVYALFEKPWFTQDIFGKEVRFFKTRFPGPLHAKGQKHFTYRLIENHPDAGGSYVVHFSGLENKAAKNLEGEVYIDPSSYAIQKVVFRFQENIKMEITYTYTVEEGISIPLETTMELVPLNDLEPITLLGTNIPVGQAVFDNEQKTVAKVVRKATYFDFQNQSTISERSISIDAADEALFKSPDYWENNRSTPLSRQEEMVVAASDTLVKEKYINERLEVITNFNFGYLRLGLFTFDLKYLIKYNGYEGLRLGIGGDTNEQFSDLFSVGGYFAHGFQDHQSKYQLRTRFFLSKDKQTSIGAKYTDDIQEVGSHAFLTEQRSFSLFEPRLVNIIQFYKHQTLAADFSHRINAKLFGEMQFSNQQVQQTGDYEFLHNGQTFSAYTLTEVTAGIFWTPFSKYMKTPDEILLSERLTPTFSAQLTRGLKGVLDSDFDYTKLDVKIDHSIRHWNASVTEFVLEGNFGFGTIPLTHMYHAFPNSPNKETIMKRFSVAGIHSFETMYFGEFFSDRLASLHIKHRLPPFIISRRIQPHLVFLSRHAIGDFRNGSAHQNIHFNSLRHGYSESGVELNNIIYGFGLSLAYRHGAYHLPVFEDNIAFKFTFNLKL
jgi:hypothetical protein